MSRISFSLRDPATAAVCCPGEFFESSLPHPAIFWRGTSVPYYFDDAERRKVEVFSRIRPVRAIPGGKRKPKRRVDRLPFVDREEFAQIHHLLAFVAQVAAGKLLVLPFTFQDHPAG